MRKKNKTEHTPSYSNVDIGVERKRRINVFRAKRELEGTRMDKIDDAINELIDLGLEADLLQTV